MAYKKKTYVKPEPTKRIPFIPEYPPSSEQSVILEAMRSGDDNLHVEASPGSGKSTTLKWAMTKDKSKRAAMLAFSKAIVTEIEPGCAPHVEVRTAHSFGYAALAGRFGRLFVSDRKVQKIFKELYPLRDPDNLNGEKKGEAFSFMLDFIKLIDLMRANLADENNINDIARISMQYNLQFPDFGFVGEALPKMYEKMIESPNVVDFTDMMWLPIRLGLSIPEYEMVYVDERQDLNSLMIEYIFRMATGRIMTVGDKNQSIFGFGGADTKSTERLISKFGGVELPLNVCYRCGTDIVELARTVYDKILPYEKNHKGTVERREELDWDMEDGSMILSRRNALLIKPCFAFLKRGRKAIIKGKDIGAGLVRLVDSMKAKTITGLLDKIEASKTKRIDALMKIKDVKQAMIERIEDECMCITEIAMGCQTVDEVKSKIDMIFDENTKGIVLSSIHRSKGLEANHVTIIDYNRVRICNERMTPEDHIQEKNLQFVAITRAKKILHLID